MKEFFTKDRLRVICSVALSFLLCLGVFSTVICIDLLCATGRGLVLSSAEKSNYADIAHEQMIEELNYLAVPSGLPGDFFTGKIDKAEFKELYLSVTESTVTADKSYKIDLSKFNTQVYDMTVEYSKNVSGDFSESVEKDIALFATECESIYLSYINPSLLSYTLTLFASARKYVIIALIVSVVFTLICGTVLFKLNNIRKLLRYCFISFVGAAFTLGTIPSLLLITNEVSRVAISSKSLYAFITTFANSFLWLLLISAFILLFIALVMLAVKIYGLIFKREVI